eukprot:Lankesteria_metandrocarpae@DN4661_c0_g1_i1.p1
MVQFRSETMMRGTLVLPSDRAHELVDLLGRKCRLQIVDMNAQSAHRQYKKYIQRIDEMERVLRFLFEEINKLPGATIVGNHVESFLNSDDQYKLDSVEAGLQKLYGQFVKFRSNNCNLHEGKVEAMEERAVAVAATRSLLPDFRGVAFSAPDSSRQGFLDADLEQHGAADSELMGFSNIAGVIPQVEQEKFARTVFRATRGNAYTHFETITEALHDPQTGGLSKVLKSVFVIYHQGTMQSALAERILRICQAFGVRQYNWPRSFREAEMRIEQLNEVIGENTQALEGYESYFVQEIGVLLDVVRDGGNSLVEEWRLFCLKERSIYATLNLFEGSDAALRANCWYPASDDSEIRQLLQSHANNQVSAFLLVDHHPLPKSTSPPTYFRCPEFTLGFQDFVNTYGVPKYKEANPALTTIITLPFLFGIMFGDVGHGSCLFLGGLYMVLAWHRSLKYADSELVQMVGGGRYMILLMGMFAVYAGFIYNDFFALGMDIFGTRYKEVSSSGTTITFAPDPTKNTYPFGFDPVWKGSSNEIDFFNSFKMKFAVIIAYLHMALGIMHKGSNALHFKDNLTLFYEFIPQFLFLTALVGYMDFLIVYKWCTDLTHPKPSIITTIIGMFFMSVDDPFWTSQKAIQTSLVVLMVICIPWMLIPKPLLIRRQHQASKSRPLTEGYHQASSGKQKTDRSRAGSSDSDTHPSFVVGNFEAVVHHVDDSGDVHNEEEEFDFAELMIHQMIETIEFVLGVISNTASYLRLWALSLAHQQLALVFFENTFLPVLKISGTSVFTLGILLFFAFGAFAGVTIGVLLVMDSLECFLHALRLQWVEFQNKFYKADGYSFQPFSFMHTLTVKDDS